jgi:hypothetical protein
VKGIGSGTAPRLQFSKEARGDVAKRNEIGLLSQAVRTLANKRARLKSKAIVVIFRPFSRQAERFGSQARRQRDRVSLLWCHGSRALPDEADDLAVRNDRSSAHLG